MTTTNFSSGTVIASAWLNDVDSYIYNDAYKRREINVKDFGAVGDGATDDTAAIQAALDAAAALSSGTVVDPYSTASLGGAIVFLPSGKYLTTSALTIAGGVGVRGAGNRSTVIYSTYNGVILSNALTGAYDKFGILLEDFMIMGDRTKTSQVGLGLMRTWETVVKNVHVINCGSHGIWMAQTLMCQLINVESQQNVGAGLRVTDGVTSWTDLTATNLPSMVNICINGHFAYNDAAGILMSSFGATSGVNGFTFYGGGVEYNYHSSASGTGYNIELLAKNYWPVEFMNTTVEDTSVKYHIYANAADAVFKFNNLRHLSSGTGAYPEKCVYVNSGTVILNAPTGTSNYYKTTLGSNKPFAVNVAGGTAGIRVIDATGSLITDGDFVCDETGSSIVGASAYQNNFGTVRGQSLNSYVDLGNAGPSYYRTGESYPYASFSNFYRGLEFGDGAGSPDVRLERKAANILGMGTGDSFQVGGAAGETLKFNAGTANAAVATTLGSVGPTGSTAGNPQGWLRINVAGTDRFVPYW